MAAMAIKTRSPSSTERTYVAVILERHTVRPPREARSSQSVIGGRERISKATLLRNARQANQFLSPKDADILVRRFFRTGNSARGNVTSVIGEIVARRRYRKIMKCREDDIGSSFPGCDFVVGDRRYEVKSIVKPNRQFFVNCGPYDGRRRRCVFPPHEYVFVRFLRINRDRDGVGVLYHMLTLSRRKLMALGRKIRSARGRKAQLGAYTKVNASELGFPSLRDPEIRRQIEGGGIEQR